MHYSVLFDRNQYRLIAYMDIHSEIRHYAFDSDFHYVWIVQFVCVYFSIRQTRRFSFRSQGCRSERYRAINLYHLHLAVV